MIPEATRRFFFFTDQYKLCYVVAREQLEEEYSDEVKSSNCDEGDTVDDEQASHGRAVWVIAMLLENKNNTTGKSR